MTRVALLGPAGVLELDDSDDGLIVTSVETGGPQVREDSSLSPLVDGTGDRTALVGARAVTVSVSVVGDAPEVVSDLLGRVSRFSHPRLRLDLVVSSTDGEGRTMVVRPDGDLPITRQYPDRVEIVAGFVSVGPPWWMDPETAITVAPAVSGAGSGLTPNLTPPVVVPGNGDAEVGVAENAGDVGAHWVAQIEGPVTDARVRNRTTGQAVSLAGLNVTAGQVLVVDSASRSASVDGESRFAAIDTSTTEWWLLATGATEIDVPTSASGSGARMSFRWRSSYYL